MGIPTIVMLDTSGLNFSPLAGVQDSRFAGSATELASHLTSIAEGEGGGSSLGVDEFFWLDAEFPRWRRALNLVGGTLEAIGTLGRDTNQGGHDSFEVQPIMPDSSGFEVEHGTN